MRAPTGRWRAAGIAIGLVLLLTACSDDPTPPGKAPAAPGTASSSVATSPDDTMTPEQEVEAAVRHYYAELTEAAQTQDTREFRSLVTSGCPCARVARAIERLQRRGHRTPNAEWLVRSIEVQQLEGGTASAEVRYTVTPYTVVNKTGQVVERYPSQRGHVDLSLVKADRRWIVGNVFDLEA